VNQESRLLHGTDTPGAQKNETLADMWKKYQIGGMVALVTTAQLSSTHPVIIAEKWCQISDWFRFKHYFQSTALGVKDFQSWKTFGWLLQQLVVPKPLQMARAPSPKFEAKKPGSPTKT
jgi:hypothetical protein